MKEIAMTYPPLKILFEHAQLSVPNIFQMWSSKENKVTATFLVKKVFFKLFISISKLHNSEH